MSSSLFARVFCTLFSQTQVDGICIMYGCSVNTAYFLRPIDNDLIDLKEQKVIITYNTKKELEAPGIDPGTSRMLSERSTI